MSLVSLVSLVRRVAAPRRRIGAAACALLACGAALAPLGAQDARARNERDQAEQLLARGTLVSAESVYYAAVRLRPRDPWARYNLGRHVLARGAGRVAAALLEEARFFGGDQATILPDLLAAYERGAMWRAIAAFPGSAIGAGDKARAEFLMTHAGVALGADSTVLPLEAAAPGSLGRIALVIGGDTVRATIDPTVRGVLLDAATGRRRGVRSFARDAGALRVAVVDTVRAGAIGFTNVPARVVASGDASGTRVGLDWLGDAEPTVDPVAHTITLRRAPGDARAVRGARVPIVYTGDGWGLVIDGFAPLATSDGRDALGQRRWTLLTAKGEVAVLPR
ncbi:MAG: hypothetical protein HY275_05835 [Gemmatimonadetes bacterium]|nr:hypothetical protein [Gemmatimonadota bacterium]